MRKNLSAASTASLPAAEARQDVEGNGHELEGDEEQNQLARRGEYEHAEEGREHGHVVLGARRAKVSARRLREASTPRIVATRNRRLEKMASSSWTKVPRKSTEPGLQPEGQAEQDHEPDGGDHADPTLVRPAQGQAAEQHHQDDDGETDLESPCRESGGRPSRRAS